MSNTPLKALNLTPHDLVLYDYNEETKQFTQLSSIKSKGKSLLTTPNKPTISPQSFQLPGQTDLMKIDVVQYVPFEDMVGSSNEENVNPFSTGVIFVSLPTGEFLHRNPDIHPELKYVFGPDTSQEGGVRKDDKGLTKGRGDVAGTTRFMCYRCPKGYLGSNDVVEIQ